MSVTRIASRYAKSLLDLAQEQNKVERILGDVQALQQATKQRDFELVLKSPIVNTEKKQSIIKAIFNGKFDELTMGFLDIIVRKGREPYLANIADEFIVQYNATKQLSTIKITTAAPMEAGSLEAVRAQLLASSATNKNVEIETAVDPTIIGGFVIEFDDKLYNASVAHKLALLRKEFA